ncbi:hypothetical protein CVD28_00270 [Bacillus sp. M6-12]|uniref:protein-tyrosine phosphatase family protein n=1 Tax=Bacillus sp. M6-12 TaxID=2054166 RepID=UPI000C774B37|nr:protein-tyrosine phosphatase family protein [Bacillus sp. M6-12]PLS18870.1 hypothetical protein CVD28_00270 [Bacillus sp. M6-12]
MKLEIHSFQSALRLKPNSNEKTIMIRISDPGYEKERDAELLYREQYVDVLKVSFHDLTDKQLSSILEREPEAPYQTITKEQAIEILSFIQKCKDCDKVIIHCSAGISRSSAVAIGVTRFLQDKEREKSIRDSDNYIPNETIVDRLIESIGLIKS